MNISLKGKEGKKKTPLIVDYNQVIMFYHTVLRNMGLYTSIGVSILVFTRLFKDKNLYLNFLFMTLGLVFLSIGSYLSYYLIDELTSKKDRFNENAKEHLEQIIMLPYVVLLTQISFITIYIAANLPRLASLVN
tara:strand:- start:11719 stop:12120 length:402 start_codon:yes stop_codon:yes gene_type:complete